MTDVLDDLAWAQPEDDPTRPERTPRQCSHPRALRLVVDDMPTCRRCGHVIDPLRSRRGRTSRRRGGDYERELAKRFGIRRVGQLNGPEDLGEAGEWIAVQSKVGTYYPERLDGWLRAIPARADRLRAVVVGDAPGSARRRRSLIVLDLDEFLSWYGSIVPAETL